MHEAVRVSELLEIPTLVASTDLLGIFPSSMGPLMEQRLGLQVLPIPIELPSAADLHDLARDASSRPGAPLATRGRGAGTEPLCPRVTGPQKRPVGGCC